MPGESPTDPTATRTAAARTSAGGSSETLADAERIEAATTVGRFTILQVVGAGGMGQVYAAYDPQLDRRVALKLLHTPDDEIAKRRLVREAQALARLSHPNVVGVHEVGSHEGRVFVAMEFVEGETLKAWAHANPPGEPDRQRRALELLIHAARGLAAAHEAGLVHRDVKPGNILVGRDGRVRVADFGLARADEEAPAPAEALEASLSSSQSEGALVGAALTRTGMIAGTPAYMAPEQLTSEPVSAASDQFGFCVTAWEVLYGRRPFELGAIVALLQAILDGRVDRPQGVDVPDAVEAALRKGLQYRPKRRHRSMNALVGALENELRRLEGIPLARRERRRRALTGLAVAGVAAAVGAWSLRSTGPSCRPDPSSFAGVWDDARKSAIASAILGTRADFASATWSRLEPAIDGWRDEWLAARTDACEATHVRGEQSPELLDLRIACLEERRVRFEAFLGVLEEGRVDTIAVADDAFAELPPIGRCAQVDHLRRTQTQPEDPALAARVIAVERTMAEATARLSAGNYEDALAIAAAAAAEVGTLGHDRTEARVRLLLGKAHFELLQYADAEAELASAYLLARRADDRDAAAEISRLMTSVTGVAQQRFADGRWWASIAMIEARRTDDEISVLRAQVAEARLVAAQGDNRSATKALEAVLGELPDEPAHELLRAQISLQLSDLLVSGGQNARGRDVLEEALRIMTARLGPAHPSLANVHVRLSRAKRVAGDLEGSDLEIGRALEIAEGALGPRHVLLRPILDERADVRWAHGDLEGTLEDLERALKLDVPRPLRPLSVAMLLSRRGNTWLGAGRPDRAEPVLREAVAIMRDELGERHWLTARHRVALAAAIGHDGRRAEADAELEQALALGEELLGRDHPEIAVVHDEISMIRLQAGDLEAALQHARRALEIVRASEGGEGLAVVRAEGNMCAMLEKSGRAREAASHCEEGLAIARRVDGVDPGLVADLENNLGAALVPLGRLDEAADSYTSAHDVWVERFGPGSPQVGIALANLAEVRERSGDFPGARTLYARSLAIRERASGSSHPSLVVPLLGLARTAFAQDEPDAALQAARRAVGICDANPMPPSTIALAREQLALALARIGRRRDGLREARRALEALQAAGPRAAADEARISAWIDGGAR